MRRHLKRPVGVAGWETTLVEKLPKALAGGLPPVEELEAELGAVAKREKVGHSKRPDDTVTRGKAK